MSERFFISKKYMNQSLIVKMNQLILRQIEGLLPAYIAIYNYLNGDDCDIEQPRRNIYIQLVALQLFVNYFYSIYLVSLNGALDSVERREQQVHLKYVNAYVLEGFKALWGFGKHNNSLWGSFTKLYASIKEIDSFDEKINKITEALKEYEKSPLANKDERDLALHYQINSGDNPLNLIKLDEITLEKELKRYEQFGLIFRKMGNCITELINYYLVQKIRGQMKQMKPVFLSFSKFDQFVWKDKLDEIDSALNNNIKNQSISFERCKQELSRWPKIIKEVSQKYDVNLSDCNDILPSAEVMLAISYFSIDLCSSLKRYFKATLPIERAIALSRMNIICYSIIDRVYGYDSRENSYWEEYLVRPYSETELPSNLQEIKIGMETLISSDIYSKEKRATFVHLKKDNFLSAIRILYNQDPLKEIVNVQTIIRLFPKIQQAINEGLVQIDGNIKQRNFEKNKWMNEYIAKFEQYKDHPVISNVYKALLEMQKGNCIEALNLLKNLD